MKSGPQLPQGGYESRRIVGAGRERRNALPGGESRPLFPFHRVGGLGGWGAGAGGEFAVGAGERVRRRRGRVLRVVGRRRRRRRIRLCGGSVRRNGFGVHRWLPCLFSQCRLHGDGINDSTFSLKISHSEKIFFRPAVIYNCALRGGRDSPSLASTTMARPPPFFGFAGSWNFRRRLTPARIPRRH